MTVDEILVMIDKQIDELRSQKEDLYTLAKRTALQNLQADIRRKDMFRMREEHGE